MIEILRGVGVNWLYLFFLGAAAEWLGRFVLYRATDQAHNFRSAIGLMRAKTTDKKTSNTPISSKFLATLIVAGRILTCISFLAFAFAGTR